MDIRPLRTEEDYEWALAEIEVYFDNEPGRGTAEADRFDVLATLIQAYEDRHWPIEAPDPIDMIREVMAMKNLSQVDLANLLGSRSRASEVLLKRRGLTIEMVQKLSTEWNIPAESLIRPYSLDN